MALCYGLDSVPLRYLHDQEGEFENKLFHQLKECCGMVRSRTTAYHQQGNEKTERLNQILLLVVLRKLPRNKKSRWKDSLNKVVHDYNCTQHEATGFSLCFLLFGWSPRLPIDVIFGIQPVVSQWRPPTLYTRDSLGTPSFHHPTVLSTTLYTYITIILVYTTQAK